MDYHPEKADKLLNAKVYKEYVRPLLYENLHLLEENTAEYVHHIDYILYMNKVTCKNMYEQNLKLWSISILISLTLYMMSFLNTEKPFRLKITNSRV
ncbi:hypothetical protein DX928_23335 [Bacillus swezeyi]|uniref:Uncharacterized protein n=1 Tax=Bacillus swezeyi TaxID=1925020 RepID=A0A5M8RHS8_9BACI|nr:hypothetical protein DX927_23095 [Bacillus swezeyi]KAA6471508.1 hypothetical protein DX928_23335 [Bacillus swezeyi]